jgi:hypothetical protein
MGIELEKKLAMFMKRLKRQTHKCLVVDVKGDVSFQKIFDDFECWQELDDIVFSSGEDEGTMELDTSKITNIIMDIDDTWVDLKNGLSLFIYTL